MKKMLHALKMTGGAIALALLALIVFFDYHPPKYWWQYFKRRLKPKAG